MNCIYCSNEVIKRGISANGIQIYYCKSCKRAFKSAYIRRKHNLEDYRYLIIKLNNEGVGLRSMGRILNIPFQTVLRMMSKISDELLINKKKEN
jgi:transposase-like protein